MVTLLFLGPARSVAGVGSLEIPATTVDQAIGFAISQYGSEMEAMVKSSRIWLNGDEASPHDVVTESDELAIVPPSSGG